MRWLRKWWSAQKPPHHPVLLRVGEPDGTLPTKLEIEATWHPSGHRQKRVHHTAKGLCVVPWLREQDSVHFAIRSGQGEGEVTIKRDRADAGRVTQVPLVGINTP